MLCCAKYVLWAGLQRSLYRLSTMQFSILPPLANALIVTVIVVLFQLPSSKGQTCFIHHNKFLQVEVYSTLNADSFISSVASETLLIIKNVGVYLTKHSWYGLSQSTFIPSVIISDVVIYEAISMVTCSKSTLSLTFAIFG